METGALQSLLREVHPLFPQPSSSVSMLSAGVNGGEIMSAKLRKMSWGLAAIVVGVGLAWCTAYSGDSVKEPKAKEAVKEPKTDEPVKEPKSDVPTLPGEGEELPDDPAFAKYVDLHELPQAL